MQMSIYYLNAEDFGLENGHMAVNAGGITMVMFQSTRCRHCITFAPQFKQLPGSIVGVNFGLCTIGGGSDPVIQMSQTSSTPISAVPKFILYNDGLPYVEYTGQRSRQAILSFLQDIISKLNQKQSFTRPQRTRRQQTDSGVSGPTRPGGMSGADYSQQQQQTPGPGPSAGNSQGVASSSYKITPSTGVKEYETSYGRPYNTLNESEFLEYEAAYKQQMGRK